MINGFGPPGRPQNAPGDNATPGENGVTGTGPELVDGAPLVSVTFPELETEIGGVWRPRLVDENTEVVGEGIGMCEENVNGGIVGVIGIP